MEIQHAKAKRASTDEAQKEAEKRAATEAESSGGRQPAQQPQKIVKQIEYIHAPIAKHHCTAMFATEQFTLSGTAASSFACATVLLHVLSPMFGPACGTVVQSAKAAGRIQSKHKKPDGKTCPRTRWQSM